MKLATEYPYVVEQFKKLKNVQAYAEQLKKVGGYNDFCTRIAWDMARACIPINTLCEWYDKYNCNDNHKSTLFKKALKEVYPEIYAMGGM